MSSKIVFQKRHTRYKALESYVDFDTEFFDKHLFAYQSDSLYKLIKITIPTAKIRRRRDAKHKDLFQFYVSFSDEADEAFFLVWSSDGLEIGI